MKSNKILRVAILLLLASTLTHLFVPPAHAAPTFIVSLSANSTSTIDTVLRTSFIPNATFRAGVFVNATSANPLANVFAWGFVINYDPTILVPQADPVAGSATDHADSTLKLGSQATPGTANWQAKVAANQAIGGSAIYIPGQIQVYFTTIAPNPAVTLTARTLLANVAFELITKTSPISTSLSIGNAVFLDPSATAIPNVSTAPLPTGTALTSDPKLRYVNATNNPSETWAPGKQVVYDTNNDGVFEATTEPIVIGNQGFRVPVISDPNIKFVDTNGDGHWDLGEPVVYDSNGNGMYDPGEPIISGSQALEKIMNDPPHASFTYAHTGTSYIFTSTSTDTDDTIKSYRWDFGDKTGGTNTTSLIATHDYGIGGNRTAPGLFDVTLRVVDTYGATGSARDNLGNVVKNSQPSHTYINLGLVERGTLPIFTITPTNPTAGATVTFDATASTYQDEPILAGPTPRGGTTLSNSDSGNDACFISVGSPCTIGFVDSNGNGIFDPGIDTVVRANDGTPTCNAGSTGGIPNCQIMAGPSITPNGQTIIIDLKITYWDSDSNAIWDSGETVVYDSNGDLVYNGIKTYSWDFGDGSTGTGVTTTHAYTSPNTYSVTLTLIDNATGQTSLTHTVQVLGLPPAITVSAPGTSTTGTTVTITLAVSSPNIGGSISSIKVDWGDGIDPSSLSGTATSASHTYSTAGSYTITVTATDNQGMTTSRTQAISVSATSPGPSITTIALIVIPIIGIVAVAIFLLRRRKPQTQPMQPKS